MEVPRCPKVRFARFWVPVDLHWSMFSHYFACWSSIRLHLFVFLSFCSRPGRFGTMPILNLHLVVALTGGEGQIKTESQGFWGSGRFRLCDGRRGCGSEAANTWPRKAFHVPAPKRHIVQTDQDDCKTTRMQNNAKNKSTNMQQI